MSSDRWLWRALAAISAVTVLSGLAQALAPRLVLGLVGAEATPAAAHFFGIVGMFMVLFGGLLLHALTSRAPASVPVLWAALQKLGAAGAVGLGVARGVFGPLALGVAGFDLLSGVLILVYLRRIAAAAPSAAPAAPAPGAAALSAR